MHTQDAAAVRQDDSQQHSQDHRCPSCGAGLVLRSGPVLAPHLAHRPRQACRRGERAVRIGGPVQLRLFELDPAPARARPPMPRPATVRWWQEELPLRPRRAVRYRTVRVRRAGAPAQAQPSWWRRIVERMRGVVAPTTPGRCRTRR